MFDEQLESLLAKYEGKLSVEGRTAFIAQCVRRGYTSNPEHAWSAAAYFQDRKLEDSAIVLGSGRRSVSVAHAVAQRYTRRPANYDVDDHVLDCEREGLFAAAAVAADNQGQRETMRMYQELNEFLVYGPYPELDIGLLFEAANAADSHRKYAKEIRDLKSSDEAGLIENAKYLRDLGNMLLKIKAMNCELQDFA